MAKKLAGYVFRKIRGRIVPIRKSLGLVDETINRAAAAITKTPSGKDFKSTSHAVEKLGRGVDFTVFKFDNSSKVLKLPRSNPTREIKDPRVLAMVPNINDKVARSQSIANNLPNYGIPTLGGFSVRISKRLKALVQEFAEPARSIGAYPGLANKNVRFAVREADALRLKSGLSLDAHYGNVSKSGLLIDTALGHLPTHKILTQSTSMTEGFKGGGFLGRSDPDIAKELLSGGNIGLGPKDFKKADFMTAQAAYEAPSAKINRYLKKLKKEGYRFKPGPTRGHYSPNDIDQGEFVLQSPAQRIESAEKIGIKFVKRNGKVVPVRGKK